MKEEFIITTGKIAVSAGFLLFQTFMLVLPVQSDMSDWASFSRSLNDSFSPNHAYTVKNAVLLVLLIVLTALLILLFRWYFSREKQTERQQYLLYREHKKERAALQPDSRQQRSWFRLPTSSAFKWIPADRADKTQERLYNRDKLYDISGGGLCFTTAAQLQPGEEIVVLLEPPGIKPFKIYGQILRVEENHITQTSLPADDFQDDTQPREPFEAALQFVSLPPGEQERLISWIAKGQREFIQEEKLEEDESDELESIDDSQGPTPEA